MRKTFLPIFISFVLLFSTSSLAAAANNPQDAIAKSKLKFQQMNESIIETNKKVADLNNQVEKLSNDIAKNNADISKNKKLIEDEKSNLKLLTEQVSSNQDVANKRLRTLYINGFDESFFNIILESKDLSDFLNKYDAIRKIVSFDKKIFDDLSSKKKLLNDRIDDLNSKVQQLQELQDNNTKNLAQLNDDKKNLQNLIKEFNQEKNAAAEQIKENEEKLISFSLSVINSSSSAADIRSAIDTLNSLLPQISTASVRKEAQNYINSGNKKLASMSSTSSGSTTSNDRGSYKATFTMESTAYTGGGVTAIGLKTVRNPSGLSTVAVDPSVLPLGTKVYIPGYGYAICSDTGSSIKGNIIDLYMNSLSDCYSWGKKTVNVYVVAYPGQW